MSTLFFWVNVVHWWRKFVASQFTSNIWSILARWNLIFRNKRCRIPVTITPRVKRFSSYRLKRMTTWELRHCLSTSFYTPAKVKLAYSVTFLNPRRHSVSIDYISMEEIIKCGTLQSHTIYSPLEHTNRQGTTQTGERTWKKNQKLHL